MSKTKMWLLIAASLVVTGCLIFGGVMMLLKWDFLKLSTDRYVKNVYRVDQPFTNITIDADTADLTFAVSKDGKCRVESVEREDARNEVTVLRDTLTVKHISGPWYKQIGFNFQTPKITVYLPQTEYTALKIQQSTGDVTLPEKLRFGQVDITVSTGDVEVEANVLGKLTVETSTGDIHLSGLSAGELDLTVTTGRVTVNDVKSKGDVKLQVSTGKAQLKNVTCKNLTTNGSTGDITLDSVFAEEKFTITRTTGDVKFEGADAGGILVQTDTGDVTGTFLTGKYYHIHSDTGKVDVPANTQGARCEIHTSTGNINLRIQ